MRRRAERRGREMSSVDGGGITYPQVRNGSGTGSKVLTGACGADRLMDTRTDGAEGVRAVAYAGIEATAGGGCRRTVTMRARPCHD